MSPEEHILFKLNQNDLSLKEMPSDDTAEIYSAYRQSGGLCAPSPRDTHYIMDGSYIVFIGSKAELAGFLNGI